jgi:hypothetical protein
MLFNIITFSSIALYSLLHLLVCLFAIRIKDGLSRANYHLKTARKQTNIVPVSTFFLCKCSRCFAP